MAAISTVRSGNWSDTSHITGPWPGASTPTTLPTNADDVTVIKNTVLTLDSNTAVCKTLTLAVGTTGADVGAEFTCITTGNTKLVVENNITCSGATGGSGAYSSKFNLDMSAAPSYTCEIYTNNAAGTSNYGISIAGQFQLKGAPKTRWTTLTAAMSATNATATVADATGWRPGDKVVFAPTDSGSTWTTRKWDDKVLDGTYVADSESLVLTSGVTYGHANTSPVGNFTSNLVLGPAAAGNRFTLAISSPGTQMTANAYITDVEFRAARRDSAFQAAMLQLSGAASKIVAVSNNAFYDYRGRAFTPNNMVVPYTRDRNIFFASTTSGGSVVGGDTSASSLPVYIGEDTNYVVFAMSGNNASAITALSPSQHQRGHRICGCWDQFGSSPAVGIEVTNSETEVSDCLIWHCAIGMAQRSTTAGVQTTKFGTAAFSGCANTVDIRAVSGRTKYTDCYFATTPVLASLSASYPDAIIQLVNKDADPAVQQIYGSHSLTVPIIQRNASTVNRSTTSVEMTCNASTAITHEFEVLAKAGETIKILTYVRKSGTPAYGASTLPSVTISGLGITPVTSTMAGGTAADAWELLTTEATNSGSADGNLTVTFTAQSATAGAKAFFSGTPVAPFVTRARHYGYLFNETVPTVTADPLKSASEATADGYTDFTYTWSAEYAVTASSWSGGYLTCTVADSTGLAAGGHVTITGMSPASLNATWQIYDVPGGGVSFRIAMADPTVTDGVGTATRHSVIALAASSTFQKLYDSHQAKAVADVSKLLALTGAGVAGSPALFAAGNFTTSGYTLNGSGSFSLGSYTLTATVPWVYTYTGGTFSQATTVPTFSGGTLNIGAAGTYTYVQAAAMILSMTPTAPGTYALGETTFTGEVDLRNTAAHAITVELPTGASYTTASNTGGTITVSLPVVTADISITGMPTAATATTRLQIINQTALSASAWAANTVYATGAIVKRTTGLGSESTAGLYFRATTGGTSHATTEPTWDTTVGNTTADNTVVWTTYAILYYDDDPAATSLTDTYIDGEEFLDGESVEVRFAEMDGSTSFKTYSTTAVVNSAGFSVLVSEDADDVYATNALDGSDYESTFSPNFTLDYMVLDTNTDFAGKAAFAYYCYTLTTSAGMWGFWGGVTALDEGNYRVNTAILNLYFDESAGFVKQTDNVRIFRDDGLRPAIDPTTGGHGIEINWRTPVSVVTTGGSAVLPQDIVDIAAASGTAAATATLAAAQTTPIHSDVRKVVGITVDGTGTDGDTWGPA